MAMRKATSAARASATINTIIDLQYAYSRADGIKGPKNKYRIRTIPMKHSITAFGERTSKTFNLKPTFKPGASLCVVLLTSSRRGCRREGSATNG